MFMRKSGPFSARLAPSQKKNNQEMFRPKTLQRRFFIFMLFPVAFLLIVMGIAVFMYAKASLLAQWQEGAVLKLERAGREVDARLKGPKGWMKMYHDTAGDPKADSVREWLARQMEELDGVERVTLTMPDKGPEGNAEASQAAGNQGGSRRHSWSRGAGMDSWISRGMETMDFDRAEIAAITVPRYDDLVEHETVSIVSDLLDKSGGSVGKLEVAIRFQYLIEGVLSNGWAQSEKAFLVDKKGKILTCNVTDETQRQCYVTIQAAVDAMQRNSSGAIIHPDRTSDEVVGFYKLNEAPWGLVLVARSGEILAPIVHFRLIYSAMVAAFFFVILVLIRWVAGQTASSIRDVSHAARKVSMGHFDGLPCPKTEDEVGQLIQSFNEMVSQLDERIRLKEAMDLAMQVQQSLLPERPPRIDGLDLAGKSIYCDETGGDYYDFMSFPDWDSHRVGIAVGDVAGHGISAALFMTTVRALLRCRIIREGSLAEVMNDVNRLLCMDTSRSGDFMSLFLALVEMKTGTIRWVRAGHPPALLYDPSTDSFEELRGKGAVIGFDETYSFKEYEYTEWNGAKVLFLGTDGIWEQENAQGEMFGMDRLRAVIRHHCHESSQEILHAVTEALSAFRLTRTQEDDVTAVVVKAAPISSQKTDLKVR